MTEDKFDLIMAELREIRAESKANGERLVRLETQVKAVVGNGRAGRLDILEGRIDSLSAWRWWMVGAGAGCAAVISVIAWVIEVTVKR